MKRIDPVIIALLFIIIAYFCLSALFINIETDKADRYKNIKTELIIKSRTEKLTESEFIQLSDSDKLTVLNNYKSTAPRS